MSAGGHGSGNGSSDDSPRTPSVLPDAPTPPRSIGQSSKRSSREQSVCSPRKKSSKTTSLDDCIQDLDTLVQDYKRRKSSRELENEEMAKVHKILREDGFSESDLYFAQATNLCTDKMHRSSFLNFQSKEGRMNYVKYSLDMMHLQSK